MSYLIKVNSLYKIVLFLILISPTLPKIRFSDGVYTYLHEILLILLLPWTIKFFLRCKIKHRHQLYFLFAWLFILVANIVNAPFELTPYLYILKYISYSSIFFIAHQLFSFNKIRAILKISIFAMSLNLLVFLINGMKYGFSIWRFETLSSGFSNKFFDPLSFHYGNIDGGSHAIWGGYCLIILVLATYMFKEKYISNKFFGAVSLLAVISIFTTVSREALVLLLVCSPFFIKLIKSKTSVIDVRFAIIFIFTLLFLTYIIASYEFPILEKITYTVDSFDTNGTEGNLALRANVQHLILGNILINPMHALIGYGFKTNSFLDMLKQSSLHYGIFDYPSVPESAYLQFFVFGGILSLLCFILFSFGILINLFHKRSNILCYALFFITLGNIFASIFVSGTWISDMYLGIYFVILGFAFKIMEIEKNEAKNIISEC